MSSSLLVLVCVAAAGRPLQKHNSNSPFVVVLLERFGTFASVLRGIILGVPFAPFFPAKPVASADLPKMMLRVYGVPAWQLRDVPKSSAFLAFTDETGWLGHGTSKYIKDKVDFGADDAIEALAPIPALNAVSIRVRRLPATRLVVVNMYDENKLTSKEAFTEAFRNACLEVQRHDGKTVTFFDPTRDWNYQQMRVNAVDTARVVVGCVLANRDLIKGANILVPAEEAREGYVSLVHKVFDEQWRLTSSDPDALSSLLGV